IGAYEYIHPLADTDGDGVLDQDEVFNFFSDATESDTDGDGMSDGYEITYGLNPGSDDTGGDFDGDGMLNGEEFASGTNPGNSDTDGDKSPDGDEAVAATNPLDPASYFCICDMQVMQGGAGCEMTFKTALGREYTVYYRNGFTSAWQVLDTMEGTGSFVTLQDAGAGDNHRLYKAEVKLK
ncbi:MAG: hypothetical protein K9M45_11985, partial [Kiritimatiellales bacterium]|nr:hypothetical protein [Kiritimatiellales bacterium]